MEGKKLKSKMYEIYNVEIYIERVQPHWNFHKTKRLLSKNWQQPLRRFKSYFTSLHGCLVRRLSPCCQWCWKYAGRLRILWKNSSSS